MLEMQLRWLARHCFSAALERIEDRCKFGDSHVGALRI
jgi:hypothetical protein